MTGKRSETKGSSLFWRADRRCWTLNYKTASGYARAHAPREIGRREKGRAEAWARAYVENAEALGLKPKQRPGGLLVRDAFTAWKKIRANDERTSPATLDAYDELFRNVVMAPFADGRGTRSLGDEDVVSLGSDYALLRRWIRATAQRVSPTRARAAFSALRSFFDDAIVERWFRGENPFRNEAMVREQPPLPTKAERGGVVHAELATVQALICAKEIPLTRRVRYVLTATTGLRAGEVAGLTWGRLQLEAEGEIPPRLEVAKARRLRRKKDEVLGKLKARTSYGWIPLHPATIAALREWRDDLENGVAFLLGRRPLADDPVFPSERARDKGGFARPRIALKLREDLAATDHETQVHGKNLTEQALRRTFGTWLRRARHVDEVTRKQLMRHGAQDVTVEFYTGHDWRRLSDAIASIELAWTTGVTYEPPPTAKAPPRGGVRPGTLNARLVAHMEENPRATAPEVAAALGAKVASVATGLSLLRRRGLVPPVVPHVVPAGTRGAPNAPRLLEPPSRFELETYGLRNRCSTAELRWRNE